MGRSTAIGLRVHSGWAALVALANTKPSEPEVVLRRRIEIADPGIQGSKQPYHAAEGMDLPAAKRYLTRCERAARALAAEGLAGAIAALAPELPRPSRCGILLASGRPLTELDRILASHAIIHTADGEHFRAAFAEAAAGCGLEVLRVPERDVVADLAKKTRTTPENIQERVASWRRQLGAPWTTDQKLAAAAAWLCLTLA